MKVRSRRSLLCVTVTNIYGRTLRSLANFVFYYYITYIGVKYKLHREYYCSLVKSRFQHFYLCDSYKQLKRLRSVPGVA